MNLLERFVVLLYCRTSEDFSVNAARKDLFTKKGRSIDSIPPTQASLIQHTKRTTYQGGFSWGHTTNSNPYLPSPCDWGWAKDGNQQWQPHWTDLPEAAKSCRELLYCQCKKGCSGNCKCKKESLKCTAMCKHCGGECDWASNERVYLTAIDLLTCLHFIDSLRFCFHLIILWLKLK